MLLVLHAAATLYMTGLVWFVQIVHYPLLHRVGAVGFARYAQDHARRASPVVAPVMLFELATGAWLAVTPPPAIGAPLLWINAALLAVIWGSTLALQGPAHRRLADGYQADAVNGLIAGNWIRTGLWTARSGLLVALLAWGDGGRLPAPAARSEARIGAGRIAIPAPVSESAPPEGAPAPSAVSPSVQVETSAETPELGQVPEVQ